jgi:hypothetical protein
MRDSHEKPAASIKPYFCKTEFTSEYLYSPIRRTNIAQLDRNKDALRDKPNTPSAL